MAEPTTEVTLREVYDAVLDLRRTLDPLPAQVTDHETRLRSLEQKVWRYVAIAAFLAFALGGIPLPFLA